MRNAILVVCLLLVAGLIFGEGSAEKTVPVYTKENPAVLFAAVAAAPGAPTMTKYVEQHPNVAIRWLSLDVSTGGMEAINAYLQSGIKMLVKDYGGRLGLLMTPDYALDWRPYLDPDYYPDALAPVTVGGEVLALPLPGQVSNFIVNQEILDAAGYVIPDNWTTDDFLAMCEAVKTKTGKIPFAWYCGERNADYYFMHVLAWFGADVYKNGDYTKPTINSPEAVRAFEFIKTLYDRGYMHKDVLTRKAADYLQSVYSGEVAAYASFVGFTPGQVKAFVDQKKIAKEWKWRVVPFPRGPGVSRVKAFTMQHGIVLPRSAVKGAPADLVRDRAYADLGKLIRDTELDGLKTGASIPVRKADEGFFTAVTAPDFGDTTKFYGGPWDLGLFTKRYSAVRFLAVPELQAMLSGTKTPADAVASYAAEIAKVIAK